VSSMHCVCCSGKLAENCCLPFVQKKAYPKTPKKLMRSRYTAYFLGGYGDYLLATWLPAMAQNVNAIDLSRRDTSWQSLEIRESSQKFDDAYVEFAATYNDENDQLQTYYEKSVFKRVKGKWLYVGVEVE
jgi:SEC-C motif-containing protein